MKIKRYFLPKRQVYSLLKMLFLQITVSENGYSTKMTSFDDYLTKANQLEQKLLIEIKTSSTKANGYTMEYFSLDQNFMTKLLTNHKKIYAWTVNNKSVMTGMILMGVNGIITDYLTTLKEEIKDSQSDKNYSSLLLHHIQDIFNLF
ncbi:glycerophosphodiester phosphodiesterase family protein [Streptococcus mutans]|uniref:glycerophosphodiester phosphodiesterase family protein n=1 Tax=Streptococcus mutans TaxID=1309 RepID=UPI0002B59F14|nr:glycerophosphodiester phosphodiesterase family protein [Streptococcus mutans]EMB55577.1 hypothetical protein SMU88_05932 [Streptococcus mutans NLML8]EMC30981.1 hypothetical protein SMU86_03991 [Streptococcus mutans U2A]MCB5015188.1 hypothetical protein [Streptococcus mutans]NLR04248.1 hypothetical protein [Streptococcus mutans]